MLRRIYEVDPLACPRFAALLDETIHAGTPPPVDLLIRTGGERRLSDFLFWEMAYAEAAVVCLLDGPAEGTTEQLYERFCERHRGSCRQNEEFRGVLYTAQHCQLVVMALTPKEEIGAEVHKLDQFFRVEEGTGEVLLDGVRTAIRAGFAVVVPAGTNHNIINTGSVPLKLYTLYAPPNHRDGVVYHTRADAEADNEHFDGQTTE